MTVTWNKRQRRVALGATALLTALALAGCTGGAAPGGDDAPEGTLEEALESMSAMTLVYSINLPDTSSVGLAVKAFKSYVEDKTGGKITIDDQYNSTVMPAEQALEGIQTGLADIALTSSTYYAQELPVSNLLQNLGAESDPSFPAGWMQALAAGTEFFSTDDAIAQEFAAYGSKVLYATSPTRYNIMCTKPVDDLDDAHGLQTRASGAVWGAEVESMGMTPVSLPIAELYEGLQRGVIDCVTSTPDTMGSLSVPEVAKHFIPVQMSTQVTGIVLMNLDVFNGLPAPVQDVIQEGALEGFRAYVEFVATHIAGFVDLLGEDVTVHDPAALDKPLTEHQREAVDAFLADSSVPDADGIVERYRDSLGQWYEIVTSDLGVEASGQGIDAILEGYRRGASIDLDAFTAAINDRLR